MEATKQVLKKVHISAPTLRGDYNVNSFTVWEMYDAYF